MSLKSTTESLLKLFRPATPANEFLPSFIANIIPKRIDENRELACLLTQKAPDFLREHTWVAGWLRNTDSFLVEVSRVINANGETSGQRIKEMPAWVSGMGGTALTSGLQLCGTCHETYGCGKSHSEYLSDIGCCSICGKMSAVFDCKITELADRYQIEPYDVWMNLPRICRGKDFPCIEEKYRLWSLSHKFLCRNSKPKIYVASPLGFSPETLAYREKVSAKLVELGFEILDPWEASKAYDKKIEWMFTHRDIQNQHKAAEAIARGIGGDNIKMIRQADYLLAILDGMEPDSGTASELGFAAGLGKKVYGLRTDFRTAGELPGIPINIQVLTFIQESGGTLFRAIDEISFGSFPQKRVDI